MDSNTSIEFKGGRAEVYTADRDVMRRLDLLAARGRCETLRVFPQLGAATYAVPCSWVRIDPEAARG